jgi:putative glutamine amidotransferase
VVPRAEPAEFETLLALADGVLLSGSPSNVHPRHFGEAVLDASLPLDPERDAWTLALVPRLLERGIPLLAICRGAQEVNVALGGRLHQAVQEVDDFDDHRSDDKLPAEQQYAPAHALHPVAGGLLAGIVGDAAFEVNSIHGQGVAVLAAGLRAEAHAPDGLVEAFTQPAAAGFNLCVQWHPEWRADENPVSMRILEAFGRAVRAYRDRVRGPLPGVDRPAAHPSVQPTGSS